MAGLFATEHEVALLHFLEHVFVADRRPHHLNAVRSEGLLESKVRHHRRDHALHFHCHARHQHDGIAVDNLSGTGDEQRAVGIAVEGNAQVGLLGQHTLPQAFEMKRAAIQVDVAAIRRVADRHHLRAEFFEQRRGKLRSRAVSAIDHQLHAIQAFRNRRLEERDVLAIKAFIGNQNFIERRLAAREPGEHAGLECQFLLIR